MFEGAEWFMPFNVHSYDVRTSGNYICAIMFSEGPAIFLHISGKKLLVIIPKPYL